MATASVAILPLREEFHKRLIAGDSTGAGTGYRAGIDPVVTALADQHAELAGILAGLGDDDWQRPSPCEGWDVADVVIHLAQTDELAAEALLGRFDAAIDVLAGRLDPAGDVDDGADKLVASERDAEPTAIHDRWRAAAARLRMTAEEVDLRQRVQWVAGELSARSLVTTRIAECWIHTGDVAEAVGVELAPTDRLWHVARLAWRTLPYAFAGEGRELTGPVRFELRGPGGDAWVFDDGDAVSTVTGDAVELCGVAARRVEPAATSLVATGPDGADVLRLVRTYA